MTNNRLQAVLDHAARQASTAPPPRTAEPAKPRRKAAVVEDKEKGRARTILVGAHLPPQYNKQLRLLAAEEETQVNTLIREALDLLFIKKGKGRIT